MHDNRDNRGKKHDLAFVILLFMYSILRSSDSLNYLSIHLKMKKEYRYLEKKLNENFGKCISYKQFSRILHLIDYKEFSSTNNDFFGKTVINESKCWKSIDGKELRGTIDKLAGEKRSENIVQLINHQDNESAVIGFYNGSKRVRKDNRQRLFSATRKS